MKWFGKNWGAPVCREEEHIETPVGEECFGCEKPVEASDQGMVLPFMAGEGDARTRAPYHHACLLRSILGDVV